jgi:hypothetical protein
MIVPTYTNTAKNVTGVAGQQFGFKVPAGALSAGMVAEANLYQNVSTVAGQTGGYFMQQYHSAAVNGAYNEAAAQLDDLALESSNMDPTHPLSQHTPAGNYAAKSATILKQAQGKSWWPTTSTAIGSKVGAKAARDMATIKKQSNLRVLSQAKGELKTTIAGHMTELGMNLSPTWDGDPGTLTGRAWIAYNDAIYESSKAARANVQTFAEHEQVKRDVISEASVYAVGQRIRAADTWQDSEKLLAEVSDPKNWRKLKNEDRLALQKTIDAQITRQVRQEDSKFRREATERRRAKKDTQTKNYRAGMTKIIEWQLGTGAEVTYDQIAGWEITPEAQSALQNMIEKKSPQQSNPAYVGGINKELVDIYAKTDPVEIQEDVNELMQSVNKVFANGRQSLINVSDYKTFFTRAMQLQKDKGMGAALKELYGQIDEVVRERARSLGDLGMAPEDFIRVQNAREAAAQRFFQGGPAARREAFERAVNIMSDTAGMYPHGSYKGPQYPTFLPLARNMFITTTDVTAWTPDDYSKAHFYLTGKAAKLNPRQRDQSIIELDAIKRFRDKTNWAAPAKVED